MSGAISAKSKISEYYYSLNNSQHSSFDLLGRGSKSTLLTAQRLYLTFPLKMHAHARKKENKIDRIKEPLAVTQTLAISVRHCCHVAYGTRQTVSFFLSCLCLLRDDRSKSTFVSQQQASCRLSSDLGGKGEKGSASCCGDYAMCLHRWVLGKGGKRGSE